MAKFGHTDEPQAATDEEQCRQIALFIELDPQQPDPGNARVKASGMSVAAIVTAVLNAEGDRRAVAEAYGLPEAAVHAAIWYYGLRKPLIDARLALDEAFFLAATDPSPEA
jgi:hypothetical protein